LISVLVYLMFVFLVSWILTVTRNLLVRKPKKLILESITISHYVEKIRWSLDLMGIEYVEEENCGIMGIFFTGLMVPAIRQGSTRVSGSNFILKYLNGKCAHLGEESDKKEATTVSKVAFLRASSEAFELEKEFDKMGENIRHFLYTDALNSKNAVSTGLKVWGAYQPTIPLWQRLLLRAIIPILLVFMKTVLKLKKKIARERLVLAKETFKKVDALLSDGRKYLTATPNPTFVDVTFAALAAPLLIMDGPAYTCGRAIEDSRMTRSMFTDEVLKEVDAFRASPAGKFALRMYADHRGVRRTSAESGK